MTSMKFSSVPVALQLHCRFTRFAPTFRKSFVHLTLWNLEANTAAGQKILRETAIGMVAHRTFVVESYSSYSAKALRLLAQ